MTAAALWRECALECASVCFSERALGDNNDIGILLGMLVGLAVGACFQKKS